MEQVKRYAGRAAALALACFVVAFSVSVPAAAASGSSLSGTASLDVAVYYPSGSYTYGSMGLSYPYNGNGGYVSPSLTLELQPIVRTATQVYFDLDGGNTYRLHIRFRGILGNIDSQYISTHHYNGSWERLDFAEVSLQRSVQISSYVFDAVIQFDLPLNSTRLRITLNTYTSGYSTSSSSVAGVGAVDFLDIDPVIDQTAGDKAETNRVDGAVNDKTQQSNQITNQIEQLQKPNVDSSSGKPVVGGMVVDPMQQVDRDSFNAYTNVLGTIFGSSTILGYFIIVFSLIFISYVIFGKSGG